MKIITMQLGLMQTNCYILYDETAHEAAIIDPAADAQNILDELKKINCTAKYIILTHGHFDHTGAAAELVKCTGAKLVAHQLESEIIGSAALSLHTMFTSTPFLPLVADILINDGDFLELSNFKLEFIHTPGHTKGGCCIICGDNIFCGDTIFKENIGRTDFPTANRSEMSNSLKRIATLEGDFKLYPGHGDSTTLTHERKYNPYM